MTEIIKSIVRIVERTGKIPVGLIILILMMGMILGYFSMSKGIDTIIERLPQILEQLVKSPLGILALMIIALSLLAYVFFQEASENTRVVIFILMFFGVFAFGGALILSIRQTVITSPVVVSSPAQPSVSIVPTPVPTSTPIPLPQTDYAVLVFNDQYQAHTNMSQLIVSILGEQNKKAIILPVDRIGSQVTFESIFQGNTQEVQRTGWEQFSHAVVLGKVTVSYSENPQLENVITAHVTLEIHIVSSATGVITESFTIATNGARFSQEEAEQAAIERMSQELRERIGKVG